MSKKMLIDAAHPEEVRVAVVSQNKIEDFDFESSSRKPLRGNIFLARVTRVEPSLQAAFVDYGGNRHGFLAFSEIHPDYYQIPVSDRKLLQEAEQEVAELAAQLELTQRGDDDDDGDDDGEASDSDDRHSHDADDDSDSDSEDSVEATAERDDDDDDRAAVTEDEDANETVSASQDGAEEAPQEPGVNDEEEEEEDGEDQDEGDASDDENAPVAAADDEEASEDSDSADDESEETVAAADDDESTAGEEEDGGDEVSASDDADDDDDGDDADEDAPANRTQSARAARNALFERYKNAKRKRAQLLRNYKIQEVIKRRQILLIQVVKEERGNKGAALTTYLSLAGRYCVLMPNTARGGGISRKIANGSDRRRLRRVVDSLDVPQGMGLIIRTAGAKRTKTEIKRDYDYLLRLWENIRSLTLKSVAPCLIYEEASLIKRAIRDLYDKDISKVYVEGEDGYREAKDFMKMLMPSHAKNVQPYKEKTPIFFKHGVETQLDGMYHPTVRLKSGGYLVIHQTEALVAIDVNSGRATRERNIEQTALKTNVEAAEEAARQFRLRDLAGLIVIDFIDMEEPRNNRKVERALKDAMKADRARLQVGRISSFGLLELSRQRRRSGIVDGTTQACPTCSGAGVIRSHEMAALRILRAVEGEAISGKVGVIAVRTSIDVSLHVLNHHRDWLNRIEAANGVSIQVVADSDKHGDDYDLEASGAPRERTTEQTVIRADQTEPIETDDVADDSEDNTEQLAESDDKPKKRRRRRRPRRDRDDAETSDNAEATSEAAEESDAETKDASAEDGEEKPKKRRRRGRRGGRRNRRDAPENENGHDAEGATADAASDEGSVSEAPKPSADSEESKPDPEASTTSDESARTQSSDATEPETTSSRPNGNGAHSAAPESTPEETADEPVATQASESDPEPASEQPPAPQKPSRRGWWRRPAS